MWEERWIKCSYLIGVAHTGGGMDDGTLLSISHCRTGPMVQVQFQGLSCSSMPCKLEMINI